MPKRKTPNTDHTTKKTKALKSDPVSFRQKTPIRNNLHSRDAYSTDACVSLTEAQKVVVEAVENGQHPELRRLLTETGWKLLLEEELQKDYFKGLQAFLKSEWDRSDVVVYPTVGYIFHAFERTPFDRVRVVLLGQDPYHGIDQSTGLAFSVPKDQKLPSSLRNVYKEIQSDVGYHPGNHGDLTRWAEQGVLLLNTVLTVREAKAHSHKGQGWETFTGRVISLLNEHRSGLVFFLWGAHAQRAGKALDEEKHLVLKAPHPSGLSAHRGFFGCRHFSKCNDYLTSKGYDPIDWNVDEGVAIKLEKQEERRPVVQDGERVVVENNEGVDSKQDFKVGTVEGDGRELEVQGIEATATVREMPSDAKATGQATSLEGGDVEVTATDNPKEPVPEVKDPRDAS